METANAATPNTAVAHLCLTCDNWPPSINDTIRTKRSGALTSTGERQLTELEGAVLTEVTLRGNDTAYKVRRAFQLSPSVQWRGSAGAVSPAIRRLLKAGLLFARPHPSRAGQQLSVSESGKAALLSWATDIGGAIAMGMDPFRLRSGVWDELTHGRRQSLYAKLFDALEEELTELRKRKSNDIVDRNQTELAIGLIKSRLEWLRGRRG